MGMSWLFNLMFLFGMAAFLTGWVGMTFWGQAQFQPTLNPLPFAATHSCATCANWNTWVPAVMMSGSTLLMFSMFILFLGGLHVNGACFFFGFAAFTAANIMQIYYGTDSTRFNGDTLQTALWVFLAGWCVIVLGFILSAFTGLTPLPPEVKGCAAYWGRCGAVKKRAAKYKASKDIKEEEEFDDEDEDEQT